MNRWLPGGSLLLLLLAGCATAPRPLARGPRFTVMRLSAALPIERDDLGVRVDPVASARQAGEHRLKIEVVLSDAMSNTARDASAPMSGAGWASQSISNGAKTSARTVDVVLAPLPSFFVTILNHSPRPLDFSRATFALHDARGRSYQPFKDAQELNAKVIADAQRRTPELMQDARAMAAVRNALASVPVLTGELVVPPGSEWRGVVSFRDRPDKGEPIMPPLASPLSLEVTGADDGQPLPLRYDFRPEPAKPPEALIDEYEPVPGGACVQTTPNRLSPTRQQLWVGGWPIANSDLTRTLMASPPARPLMRRSMVVRGVGYGLIGLGVLGAAVMGAVLSRTVGAQYGPVGVSSLGITAIGAVLTVIGGRGTERAIDQFNVAADDSGDCRPVW